MKSSSSYLVLMIALSGACDKGNTSANKADQGSSAESTDEARKSDTKPALLERLSDFEGRAAKSSDSVADIRKLMKDGQALMDEVTSSDDKEIVTKDPVKKAMAQLTALGKKKQFLDCAAKETEKEVSTCVDEISNLSAKLFWENEVLVCQKAVEMSLEYGAEKIAESDVCAVAAPSFQPQFKIVREKSAALADVHEKKWLEKRNKALGGAWKAFAKGDAAKNYWNAVGDSLHKYCSRVADGDLDVPSIFLIDKVIKALGGNAALAKLPTTSYKKLLKDRDAEKGKVIKVRAKVLSISKDGDFFRGQLIDNSFRSYMFVTSGSTDEIYEDSRVTLHGVVSQIQQFETRGGGTNAAPVIIGFFAKRRGHRYPQREQTRSCYPAGTRCENKPPAFTSRSCDQCCNGAQGLIGGGDWLECR